MSLFLEMRVHGFGTLVERAHVDVHDAVVLGLRDIVAGLGIVDDAGVVDDDVQAAESVEGGFDGAVPVVEFRDVALDRDGFVFAVRVCDFLAVGFAGGVLGVVCSMWSEWLGC